MAQTEDPDGVTEVAFIAHQTHKQPFSSVFKPFTLSVGVVQLPKESLRSSERERERRVTTTTAGIDIVWWPSQHPQAPHHHHHRPTDG